MRNHQINGNERAFSSSTQSIQMADRWTAALPESRLMHRNFRQGEI